jgi:imidazolonepropionase-like amidohydrolase
MEEALAAGVDGLAHTIDDEPLPPALLAAIAARGVFVIPTLTIMELRCGVGGGAALAEDPCIAPYLDPEAAAALRAGQRGERRPDRYRDGPEASVRALHTAGVPLLAGTDAPVLGRGVHGASLHHELALLVRAGLTPVEVLAAVTSVPAAVFGLADRGRIAPGQRADLLLVEGDPTREIRATRSIARIWSRGLPVERARFQA